MTRDAELIKKFFVKNFDVFVEQNDFVSGEVNLLRSNGLFATGGKQSF